MSDTPERQPYDADARAAQRESTPTTIGGRQFFAVRLSNKTMKVVRSLARASQPAAKEAEAIAREIEALTGQLASEQGKQPPDQPQITALKSQIAEAEERLEQAEDVQQDASSEALFKQLKALLKDENGEHPEEDFLSEELDTRDAGGLMTWLMTDGDPDADGDKGNSSKPPTETTATGT